MREKETTEPIGWRYWRVILCLAVGFWMNVGLAAISTAELQMKFGAAFCGLVLLRVAVAAFRKERNRLWVLYSIFALCQGPLFWLIYCMYETPVSRWDNEVWDQISGCWHWVLS